MLSQAELERYNRQLLLPELGVAGQERFKRASVLVVGAGGLGSPVVLYLAAAGVGRLTLVDSDRVEASNLHRQILHGAGDVGRDKVESAADAVGRLNPHVVLTPRVARLTVANAREMVAGHDVVIDGSDNYATRYAVNDACVAAAIPWVYGSVERFSGQVAVFGLADGPCYRCIYPEPPGQGTTASCEEIGVLGAVPGVIGALQAVEALKILAGMSGAAHARLLQMDLLRGTTQSILITRRPDCAACGSRGTEEPIQAMTEQMKEQELPPFDIDPRDVQQRTGKVPARLLDVREPWEVKRASIPGAITVPLSTLEGTIGSLDRESELIVFCHHGSRSRLATEWLREQGFRARNMTGGIDRWSREVDPSVPRY